MECGGDASTNKVAVCGEIKRTGNHIKHSKHTTYCALRDILKRSIEAAMRPAMSSRRLSNICNHAIVPFMKHNSPKNTAVVPCNSSSSSIV